MNPEDIIKETIKRTLENLNFMRQKEQEGCEVFEVTQALNSFIGIVCIPLSNIRRFADRSCYNDQLEPFFEVKIKPRANFSFINRFRNGIAHGRIKYLPSMEDDSKIGSINIQDKPLGAPEIDFDVTISVERLFELIDVISAIFLNVDYNRKKPRAVDIRRRNNGRHGVAK